MGSGFWRVANAALALIEPERNALEIVRQKLAERLDWSSLPEDSSEFLMRMTCRQSLPVIYLSDNDIVEKLAICDLLDDALTAFDASRPDVFVVPTLKYRIGIGKARAKAEKRLGGDAVARILDFLSDVQEISDYSPEDHQTLDDLVGIDPGEAILLSATGVFEDYRLLTGDKRCVRTVATDPGCQRIAQRIQGRVVCLEQIFRRLIVRFGFDYVLDKVVPVLYCDNALRTAFGSGIHSTEANVVACLQSYIDELRVLPIDLLMVGH